MKHCGPSTAAFLFGAGVETGWGKAGLAPSRRLGGGSAERKVGMKRSGGWAIRRHGAVTTAWRDGAVLHKLVSWIGLDGGCWWLLVVAFAAVYALSRLAVLFAVGLQCVAAWRSARQFGLSRA